MQLKKLIEEAATIEGSQNKLADKLGVRFQHLSEMKHGKRHCSLKTRAKLADIAGYEALPFLLAAVAEELQEGEPNEKKAAEGINAILAALPDWRKR